MRKSAHLLDSLRYSLAGLWHAASHEPHFLMIVIPGGAALVLGYLVGVGPVEYAFILLGIALILCTEMLNTALEAVVDMVSPQPHPLAKVAKDVAAAAVLVVIIADIAIALVIFVPRIADLGF